MKAGIFALALIFFVFLAVPPLLAEPPAGRGQAAVGKSPEPPPSKKLPARAPLRFTFTLDAGHQTSAGVFTADGTLVRTLWRGEALGVGTHTREWDGNDDGGAALPPGVRYEVRVLHHDVRYQWDGVIGNTSRSAAGLSVHKAFDQFTSLAIVDRHQPNCRAYAAAGYNEGQLPFHSFDVDPKDPAVQQDAILPRVPNDSRANTSFWLRASVHVSFLHAATDDHCVYWANTGNAWGAVSDPHPVGANTRFVVATKVSDNQLVDFSRGVNVRFNDRVYTDRSARRIDDSYNDDNWISCVDVQFTPGVPPVETTGLAVQKTGRYLFVAHGGVNRVHVLDKTTGALVADVDFGRYGLAKPAAMATKGDKLWVLCRTADGKNPVAQRFTVDPATGTLAKDPVAITASAITNPQGLAISPVADLLVLTDAGPVEQIKFFNDATGQTQWPAYGQLGGYRNGPDVLPGKFDFSGIPHSGSANFPFVSFQPDGSFWVQDCGTYRCLHYAAPTREAQAPAFLSQIMYLPHFYHAGVDPDNAARVFGNFLEFEVPDYSVPLGGSRAWSLKRNWRYLFNPDSGAVSDLPATYAAYLLGTGAAGLENVVTLSSQGQTRTFAPLVDADYTRKVSGGYVSSRLFELYSDAASHRGGLRDTGVLLANQSGGSEQKLYPDGTIRYALTEKDAVNFYRASFTGFDAAGNPKFSPFTVFASVSRGNSPANTTDFRRLPITGSGRLIVYNIGREHGYHLGGLRVEGRPAAAPVPWLWRSAPSCPVDPKTGKVRIGLEAGQGYYDCDDGVNYAGNNALVDRENIVCGYHGEMWKETEASQWFHYYSDGLFVGQFGTLGIPWWDARSHDHSPHYADAGFAGNAFSNALTRTPNGEVYLWHNDENGHGGINRWHLAGLRSIREMSGAGEVGAHITLKEAEAGAR